MTDGFRAEPELINFSAGIITVHLSGNDIHL
jgi:hypothetical protein